MVAEAGSRRSVTRPRFVALVVALVAALLSPIAIVFEGVAVLVLAAIWTLAPKHRERLTPWLLGLLAAVMAYAALFGLATLVG